MGHALAELADFLAELLDIVIHFLAQIIHFLAQVTDILPQPSEQTDHQRSEAKETAEFNAHAKIFNTERAETPETLSKGLQRIVKGA